MSGTFRSLRGYNYRVWTSGALVSNVGTWMQRTAQDWLVLTQLTHHNATAVGIVMSLQFGPQMLLLPLTGYAAGHFGPHWVLVVGAASGFAAAVVAIRYLMKRGELRVFRQGARIRVSFASAEVETATDGRLVDRS